jgi:hypothetical protein
MEMAKFCLGTEVSIGIVPKRLFQGFGVLWGRPFGEIDPGELMGNGRRASQLTSNRGSLQCFCDQ